jgi:hypothetical protein
MVVAPSGHVDLGNEIVGVGALEYEHLDAVVALTAVARAI